LVHREDATAAIPAELLDLYGSAQKPPLPGVIKPIVSVPAVLEDRLCNSPAEQVNATVSRCKSYVADFITGN